MKKLIIVLSIFVIMIGASVFEIIFTSNFFTNVHMRMHTVSESMDANRDNLANEDTVNKMEQVIEYWEKGKEVVLILGNHNVIRSVDEKLISLKNLIRLNEESDAKVMLEVAMNYIHDLIKDNYPSITNLL